MSHSRSPRRYAFLVRPHMGGTYTVFSVLRGALARHGVELRWLAATSDREAARARMEDGEGELAPASSDSGADVGRALVQHLESHYDGVFVNVLTSAAEMNVARYLGPRVTRIMVVHNITPGTYAAARALRDHVQATIGVSPRIVDDLVRRHRFPVQSTVCVPNAVPVSSYAKGRGEKAGGPLRVLFLGRIEESAKGVLWLPEIMRQVRDAPITLTVAGDGVDRARLEEACRDLDGTIAFVGAVPPGEVPRLLATHDVLLMPSRFEGLPMVALEAMAAGCVPVLSRIRGVTDFMVRPGVDGELFGVGRTREAAEILRNLQTHGKELARLSDNARETARRMLDCEAMGSAYAKVVADAEARGLARPPLSISRWSYPRGFGPGIRSLAPEWCKHLVRRWVA
ncbi:glycosyltransferase family 4 protein [Anaeromyxobacter paludicola]|uniref:Glycosyl transferase n=1 Tax=Anaeromyxobacter paludicola TaxID=2918171 RepID=A0ABN6N8S1_9BACT|nr:glycosyltransferase family 4 protein [Anaeromyxobacter paludicola]BDG09641.1 glycosyl transferase [Anaeromyxobacter paludicola]